MSVVAAARRKWRWWPAVRFVIGIGLGAAALAALNGQRGELVGATSELAQLRISWLLLAIGLEILSFVAFGALQRRLLKAASVPVDLSFATALSFAAGAIADSVPAGPLFASVYSYRLYRRKGANDAVAAWTLLATLVCAALTLGLFATAGMLLATKESATYDLVGVVLGVLVISAVADAIVFQRRWIAHLAVVALLASRKLTGRPRRHGLEIVEEFLERLNAVRLGLSDLLATFAYGMLNWVFDCACLACSFVAVGAPIPWRGLLLAYGAAQLAVNLPITPGGLGVVEGSLTIALVAFGGSELSTVAAVLCYRIISFWGYLPIGWSTWAVMGFVHRRQDRAQHRHFLHQATITPLSAHPAGMSPGSENMDETGR